MAKTTKQSRPQKHDKYGKEVFRRALGDDFNPNPEAFQLGENAGEIRIDGEINHKTSKQKIAVEIESRVSKQVRGAILDLYLHPHEKKLLVIINKYGNKNTPVQAQAIFKELFKNKKNWHVLCLKGNGGSPCFREDIKLIMNVLIIK
jgi:hypothetical protein